MSKTSQILIEQLAQLRTELRLLLLEDFDKASRKSKLTYYTSGNRAGKLLAKRIRGHRYRTHIQHIIHPKTQIKNQHPQAIADAFSHYYGSLYNLKNNSTIPQPTPEIIETFLQSINLPELTTEHLHTLNSPITEIEVNQIIHSLPLKSPGLDGFTGEYYKAFQDVLTPHLVEIFGSAVASSSFHPEMLKAIIIALPKPGKDPDSPQGCQNVCKTDGHLACNY